MWESKSKIEAFKTHREGFQGISFVLMSSGNCSKFNYILSVGFNVLHILFCTFLYPITLFTLYFSFLPIYICSCVVLLLYNLYSLHCPLSGPDLIYISLLIIPCIIYYVTNKETLNLKTLNNGENESETSFNTPLIVSCEYIYIYIHNELLSVISFNGEKYWCMNKMMLHCLVLLLRRCPV